MNNGEVVIPSRCNFLLCAIITGSRKWREIVSTGNWQEVVTYAKRRKLLKLHFMKVTLAGIQKGFLMATHSAEEKAINQKRKTKNLLGCVATHGLKVRTHNAELKRCV